MSETTQEALTSKALIRLSAQADSKEAAIAEAAQLLIAAGCIQANYQASMLKREALSDTYLGCGVAIPHGLLEDRTLVRRSGIAVLQFPDGLEWNSGQRVHLVVAIAAQSDTHIDVLKRLTRVIQNEELMSRLRETEDSQDIVNGLLQDSAATGSQAAATRSQTSENAKQKAKPPLLDLPSAFQWRIPYPSGLHARPAQHWVSAARAHSGNLQVRFQANMANAKNLVSLLGLGLRYNDEITVSADGEDAESALDRFRQQIEYLTAAEQGAAEAQKRALQPENSGWQSQREADIVGIAASPGLAIGRLFRLHQGPLNIEDEATTDLGQSADRLHAALDTTRQELAQIADSAAQRLGKTDSSIFEAQAELLNDSDLIALACRFMVEGHGLAWSWHSAVEETAQGLAQQENELLAARAADLRDAGRRVLLAIDPQLPRTSIADIPAGSILLAEDLAPSETVHLDLDKVLALATASGGPQSHTAILARTLGLPALVAGGEALRSCGDGLNAILDGYAGRLYLEPNKACIAEAQQWQAEDQQKRQQERLQRAEPAMTRDGVQIDIGANINLPEQVAPALEQGAEAVGLMRTEFLFLERGAPSSEDEQFEVYRAMAEALNGKPLIVRALDIGGDKPLAYLNLPAEANPFLGLRGTRLLLRRQDLLIPQLRALYRAAKAGASLSLMFPMITSLHELTRLRAIADSLRQELDAPAIPLGIMIEVPAAAACAELLAAEADFFSIGTNDLTQYTLAIDRQNGDLGAEADSLHPAVLHMVHHTICGAKKHGRWVGVCGGLAGDPLGAKLLSGLGVDELSMPPHDIPSVKAALRQCELSTLQALAKRALRCASAAEVRALQNTEVAS